MKRNSLRTVTCQCQGRRQLANYYVSVGAQQEGAAYHQEEVKFKKPVAYNKMTYRANIEMNLTPLSKLYFGVDGSLVDHTLPGSEDTNSLWRAVQQLTR